MYNVFKNKIVVKQCGIVESMLFFYVLGNVIRSTSLSESTKTSTECIHSFRFLYIIVRE
jgi:hypothetical protein